MFIRNLILKIGKQVHFVSYFKTLCGPNNIFKKDEKYIHKDRLFPTLRYKFNNYKDCPLN